MVKRTILGFALCCIVFGCSSTKIFVEPEYKGKKILNASIGTVILDKNPRIDYEGNVEPEFGPGNPTALILKYFKARLLLLLTTHATFSTVLDTTAVVPEPLTAIVMSDGEGPKYGYSIPREGTQFTFAGKTPDYVLLIDRMFIGTSLSSTAPVMMATSGGGMMMAGGSSQKELKCASDVVVWDNNTKRPVMYGRVQASATGFILPIITLQTWESVTDEYIDDLFNNTPFVK